MENELLTVEAVAKQLGVHVQTVRGWIKEGDLEALRFGGRTGYKIEAEDLRQFLADRKHREPKKAAA
jgi:excisionase family DNA binding protein